jgi:hypothetical protein
MSNIAVFYWGPFLKNISLHFNHKEAVHPKVNNFLCIKSIFQKKKTKIPSIKDFEMIQIN